MIIIIIKASFNHGVGHNHPDSYNTLNAYKSSVLGFLRSISL